MVAIIVGRGGGSVVEQAVAADKGLSTLGRSPTSRGRAAQQLNGGRCAAPAVAPSIIPQQPCPANGKASGGQAA